LRFKQTNIKAYTLHRKGAVKLFDTAPYYNVASFSAKCTSLRSP